MAEKIKQVGYATYPYVDLQDITTDPATKQKKKTFIKRLLFGDYMKAFLEDNEFVTEKVGKEEYIKIRCRNAEGWIKRSEIQFERPVEINFIDVGQGDGCHVVTPDDKHFIIDAGKEDNMYRFLKWRFNLNSPTNKAPGLTVVMTHSDADHYQGFGALIDKANAKEPQITIKKIYHNGMIEGAGKDLGTLGTLVEKGEDKFITDLCETDEDYQHRLEELKSGKIKAGPYLRMFKKSPAPKLGLHAGTAEEPVYLYNKNGVTMEVMGPVVEDVDGKPGLRVFASDTGKTKNGHSVVLKLTVGHLRLLLGGDLNTESEYNLIKAYSGKDVAAIKKELAKKKLAADRRKELENDLQQAIKDANKFLGVDIAKSCHHGSDDFSSEFLQVLNPVATVISSGDEESYCHPRPDTLGTIGKFSRGSRPMIYSTELARSGKEFLELDKLDLSAQKKKERVVTVYGMINVRTDGERVVFAQKLEKKAQNGNTWDIHKLEWNEGKGEFELVGSKEK